MNERGATLIELMTAVFILAVALLGALGLATSNMSHQGVGAQRLVALNLAREGVEITRTVRDSNWLASAAWDLNLTDGSLVGSYCATIPNGISATFKFDPLYPCAVTPADRTHAYYRLWRSAAGEYTQKGIAGADADALPALHRRIVLSHLCTRNDGAEELVCTGNAGEQRIGLQVTAEVTWQFARRPYLTTLTEKLYDWK